MSSDVSLRASHPTVLALVGEWLADARITLPRPVTLVIDVGALPPSAPDARKPFGDGCVTVRTGPPANDVTLEWAPSLGRATIEPGSTTAHVVIVEAGLEKPTQLLRTFLLMVLIFLVRRVGLHHVHGALLRDPRDRGWLVVGESRSGKSTTTALLAGLGWSVATDDISFVVAGNDASTTDVVAWRERLALREDAVEALARPGGTLLAARRKTGWFAEELGAQWFQRIAPEVLLFPTVRADAPTSITPITATKALLHLVKSSPWVALESDLADTHLALMSQLVKQARLLEVSLGRDILAEPALLAELVA